MRAYFRLAVLIPALFFVLPVVAQKPSELLGEKNDEAKYKAKIYQGIAKTGKFSCKITGLPDDLEAEEKVFEVTVDYEVKKPNPEGQKKYNDILRQLRQTRDRNQYKKLYQDAVAAAPGTYDIEKTPFTFKLVHGMASAEKKEKGDKEEKTEKGKAEKAKGEKGEKGEKTTSKTAAKGGPKVLLIRREVLPPKDPENPKAKYTAKEIKELKGPGNYIGYTASLRTSKTA